MIEPPPPLPPPQTRFARLDVEAGRSYSEARKRGGRIFKRVSCKIDSADIHNISFLDRQINRGSPAFGGDPHHSRSDDRHIRYMKDGRQFFGAQKHPGIRRVDVALDIPAENPALAIP